MNRPKNEILWYIYENRIFPEMKQYPIIVLASRKLTRANTYHYAPRDGSRGLIFTDMIFQAKNCKEVERLVQLAGRLTGHIKQSINYFGITYHTTNDINSVVAKSTEVNLEFNENQHRNKNAGQALLDSKQVVEQKNIIQQVRNETPIDDNNFKHKAFKTQEEARLYSKTKFGKGIIRRERVVTKDDRRRMKLPEDKGFPTIKDVIESSSMRTALGDRFDKTPLRMIPIADGNKEWLLYWNVRAINNHDKGPYIPRRER
jgi:hypothetical protein